MCCSNIDPLTLDTLRTKPPALLTASGSQGHCILWITLTDNIIQYDKSQSVLKYYAAAAENDTAFEAPCSYIYPIRGLFVSLQHYKTAQE